jgi:nucleoside-diphosphate-sugar epimerase
MKISVSGASGDLGRAVVSELLRRPGGRKVVAITRTPENVSGPVQGRFGDYNRPESLADAYAGLDKRGDYVDIQLPPVLAGPQIKQWPTHHNSCIVTWPTRFLSPIMEPTFWAA